MELTDKTAIITGAGGQLGQAVALSLADKGLDCVCHYHTSEEAVRQVVQSIRQQGRKAVAVKADLADADATDIIFQKAKELGPVRVLINSASIFARQPLGTFSQADVSRLIVVNLTAPLLLCNAFAAYLKRQGADSQNVEEPFAAIINLVDVAGVKPWGKYSPYCASRGGLIAATKSLAKELAPGVTVNAIAPGIVTWPGKMDPSEEQKQLKMIPAGRFGNSKDITRTIEFLLDNPYITGQTICVDGGRSI
ncbi:MAG: SDR family NAD(P)-dependent oxidoreductase [Phycisphaerae bacterium]|nr:SDR family NAD(P)-dependent oxidoreductase [Phycisphaerae bacterium]